MGPQDLVPCSWGQWALCSLTQTRPLSCEEPSAASGASLAEELGTLGASSGVTLSAARDPQATLHTFGVQ